MKKALVILFVLIFSELSLYSQSFHRSIIAEINPENSMSAVYYLNNIKDSIIVDGLKNTTKVVDEKSIFPLTKANLKEGLTWSFTSGISARKSVVLLLFSPYYLNNSGEIFEVTSLDIKIVSIEKEVSKPSNYRSSYSSVLAQGDWHKYAIVKEGIYKIDFADMLKAGIAVNNINNVNEIKIHSFGGGMLPYSNAVASKDDLPELAIEHFDNGNGIFDNGDYVLFYAESSLKWKYDDLNSIFKHQLNLYSDTVFYYLTYNSNAKKEINAQISSNTKTIDAYTFADRQFHESEEINLLRSGSLWLGDHFPETQTLEFFCHFPNIDLSSNCTLQSKIYAKNQASGGSTFNIALNNGTSAFVNINSISGNSSDDVAKNATNISTALPISDSIKISYTYNAPNSFSEGWIDYFDINAQRKLIFSDSVLFFRTPQFVGMGNVVGFNISNSTSNLQLWEIGDFQNVKQMNYAINGDTINFNANMDTLREFVLFNPNETMTPLYYAQVKNQNLHALPSTELLIVTHQSLLNEAQRLANFHEIHDSLSTTIVLVNEIFNEFAGGIPDVSGIRNFVKMMYDNVYVGSDTLKYLLLFGDGTYDYKNLTPGNKNLIPTFQSANSTKETASYTSDDFFSLLDSNEGAWTVSGSELPDVAVGRIPVTDVSTAKPVVDKILSYANYFDGQNTTMIADKEKLFSNWKNEIMFIGDDEDYNIHVKQADQLATKIAIQHPVFNVDKVFLDSYKQEGDNTHQTYPEARKDIVDKINNGVFMVNYTGHGGEEGLTAERVFTTEDIVALKNGTRMPLFFTATCDFSRYDMINSTSAGEELLLNGNGGAIALFTTTRIVYSSPNFVLNTNFYNIVFDQLEGEHTRIGDVFKDTKILNNGGINDRNFTLLGDPALALALPSKRLSTKILSTFNLTQNTNTDTLKSLMKIRVSGEITDTLGNKQNNFNGYVYTKLYDKNIPYTTLLNDGGSAPYAYFFQHNSLFEGKSSISNGSFSVDFMIPKDIAYQVDFGKLSFYAVNKELQECSGFHPVLIGGMESNAYDDSQGPEIKLYMNDSSFIFGNATDPSPLILVMVKDSSGINITSENIGHSMTAIVDNQSTESIALSKYFEPNINSYQQGKIKYRLADLQEGRHTVEVKIHDTYNNSSRAYTEFIVAGNAAIALSHILNYPNPFTSNTSFYFEHNQPGRTLEITLQIFTVSGKLIKTIYENIYSDNIRVGPIAWDGLDDYGEAIGKGVYIYKVQVKGEDGSTAHRFEKLVVLK